MRPDKVACQEAILNSRRNRDGTVGLLFQGCPVTAAGPSRPQQTTTNNASKHDEQTFDAAVPSNTTQAMPITPVPLTTPLPLQQHCRSVRVSFDTHEPNTQPLVQAPCSSSDHTSSCNRRVNGAFRAAPPRLPSHGRISTPNSGTNVGHKKQDHGNNSGPTGSTACGCSKQRAMSAGPRGNNGRNFVAENREAAMVARPRSASVKKPISFDKDGSNVPAYLQRIKLEMADEERFIAEKLGFGNNNNLPPGQRLLPDAERLDILAGLEERKKNLNSQHARLPLSITTESQRRRADELEKALRDIEKDIVTFSQLRLIVTA